MTRRTSVEEWHGDDGDEEDEPDFEGDGDTDDAGTIDCPYCRREIIEDAVRCPYCGNYLSSEDAPRESKPLWWLIGAVLALAASLVMVFAWHEGW